MAGAKAVHRRTTPRLGLAVEIDHTQGLQAGAAVHLHDEIVPVVENHPVQYLRREEGLVKVCQGRHLQSREVGEGVKGFISACINLGQYQNINLYHITCASLLVTIYVF